MTLGWARFTAAALAGAVLAGAAGAQPAMAPPVAGLTKGQAEGAFVHVALVQCLRSRVAGVMISDLPPEIRGDLRRATAQYSVLVREAAAPNWVGGTLGGLMVVSEPSRERCDVTAMQLPVDPTFQYVLKANAATRDPLAPVSVKAGYNPIAYQLERVTDGQRYIVHLEGAEPGGLGHPLTMAQGHAFRFSLLHAWVVRQPADAKPLFR